MSSSVTPTTVEIPAPRTRALSSTFAGGAMALASAALSRSASDRGQIGIHQRIQGVPSTLIQAQLEESERSPIRLFLYSPRLLEAPLVNASLP